MASKNRIDCAVCVSGFQSGQLPRRAIRKATHWMRRNVPGMTDRFHLCAECLEGLKAEIQNRSVKELARKAIEANTGPL